MNKVLNILITINVQAKPDINLGGQGVIITNQGVAVQPCFHASKNVCNFIKQAMGLCL